MNNLSIFIDESGDFGEYSPHSPYYIVSVILHEQNNNITHEVDALNHYLHQFGYREDFVIHTEPLIRKEGLYAHISPNERRSLFTKLFVFIKRVPIVYKTFVFEKKEYDSTLKLQGKIARELSLFLRENLAYFQSFDQTILYYDNGQHELSRTLNNVLATELSAYDVRKVLPKDYKLFQAADLICTLTLVSLKADQGALSRSEKLIFHNKRNLKKQFLIPLSKKEFSP